jgi:hypothetical protein
MFTPKQTIIDTFKKIATDLSLPDLLETKRQVNRQLAFGKVSDTFNSDPVTAYAVAEVLQKEYFKRMAD